MGLNTATDINGVELVERHKDSSQSRHQPDTQRSPCDEKVDDGEALPSSSGAELELRRCATFPGSEGNSQSSLPSTWVREQATEQSGVDDGKVDDLAEKRGARNVLRTVGDAPEERSEAGRPEGGSSRAPAAVDAQRSGRKKGIFGRLWRTRLKGDTPAEKSTEGGKGTVAGSSSRVLQQGEEERVNEIAEKMGGLRAKLPLSKLKIVIGE